MGPSSVVGGLAYVRIVRSRINLHSDICSVYVDRYVDRCHVKMGTPYFGDPGSLKSYEYGDPGSPYPYEYRDPAMILGTPLQTF